MSYVALVTARYEEVIHFYGETLGFRVERVWERTTGRGQLFDLNGLRLEILDASRESNEPRLEAPGDRFHLVIEVSDVDAARQRLKIETSPPVVTRWGARLFSVRDPDGVPVWFLQWVAGRDGRNRDDPR